MKKIFIAAFMMASFMPMMADNDVVATTDVNATEVNNTENEFGNEESVTYGVANDMIEKVAALTATPSTEAAPEAAPAEEKIEYGPKQTGFASTPKFGGYFIGKYAWNSDDAQDAKAGFSQRLIRVYVDGKILNDFTYRIQMQINNSTPHMKDFFVEWGKYKEFKVKIGQFKRAFTFENPMNPWDVGVGDYSQLVKKLAGMGDRNGEANMGGRDQGLQIQGDLFPAEDGHNYVHYQAMVANGQGINVSDANQHKDLIGTIQVQPIKNLFIGAFGWTGNYTSGGVTVDRKRFVLSAKYTWHDWVFRTEWGKSKGYKISDWNAATNSWKDVSDKADAFYATVGVPVVSWFNVYLKYDQYRDYGTDATKKTIYSIAPTFRLHKNLMFQLQYNYNNDKQNDAKYSELWLETYVRF